MSEVLVVDDEVELCRLMAKLLTARGHQARCAASFEEALASVRRNRPDLVLLDLHLGSTSGLGSLRQLDREAPGVPIVVITAYGSVETAVKALKFGAADFVTKPFDNEKLLDTVDALLVSRDEASKPSSSLVGESPRFLEVMELALRFARPDVNLLLLGETGTGKEVLARAIHAASKRNQKPLVTVDCSVLSESLLESELFGHEKGAFTGATGTRIGHFERAQGGHSLPRRDRQSAALHPGQAAAGPPGAHLLAGRRDRHNPPRRARDLGDERRFRRGHPSRHVP